MNKKIYINFSFIYFILLIPFFKTDYVAYRFEVLSDVFNIFKVISIIVVFFLIIRNKYISKMFILIFLFCLSILIPTFMYNGDLVTSTNYFITILVLSYLIDYYKTNLKFIGTLLFCFELLIYINFFTMIVFPKGMYNTGTIYTGIATQNWVLGFKNVMISYFLPAFITANIYKNLTEKKIRKFLLTIIILLSTLLSGSTTSIIGIIVMLIFDILISRKHIWHILNLKNYYITSIAMFVLIVFIQIQEKFKYFFIVVLKKDLTFSNRIGLWSITLKKIINKPIFGHGWQLASFRHLMYNSHTIITAHNQYLEYLYLGGIVCLTLYFYMIIKTNNEIKKNYSDKNIQIISLGFFILQILNLAEVYLNPIMMLVLIYLLYSSNYIKRSDNDG